MAMMSRNAAIALTCAAIWSIALPVLMSPGGVPAPNPPQPPQKPIAAPPTAQLAASYRRDLFAPAGGDTDSATEGAPELLGIAGRLSQDAVAMVRGSDGATRSLKPGEGVDGWRLAALAPDAAFFTRGNRRVRVAVSTGEAPADPAQ